MKNEKKQDKKSTFTDKLDFNKKKLYYILEAKLEVANLPNCPSAISLTVNCKIMRE
jgi:hypothetical protein